MDKPAGEPQLSSEHGSSSIDYLLRTQQQNNLQLSAMADQKASVLLGASFVVASLVMGDLATGNDLEPALVVLAITVVGSGILSALALMPQLRRAGRSQRSANPLFFGFVATLERENYRKQMHEVMSSDQSIYDASAPNVASGSGGFAKPGELTEVEIEAGVFAGHVPGVGGIDDGGHRRFGLEPCGERSINRV